MLDLFVAVLLLVATLALVWQAAGWVLMWAVAAALFIGVKWLTWRAAWPEATRAGWRRNFGYWLAWPGMDARRFLDRSVRAKPPRPGEWRLAAAKSLLGGGVVWGLTRLVLPLDALTAGWIGMVGLVLCLHCGLFHLLSLGWRTLGVAAEPIMENPVRASSVADFWGRRWNRAFSDAARGLLAAPLARSLGAGAALCVVFGVSGLVHELVISVPARGGYGVPTAYFLLQAAAMAFERGSLGRRLGLGRGWRGRWFALGSTAVPALALFSPQFVAGVILPFLDAVGAA